MEPWMAAARRTARELGSPVLDLFVDELEVEYLYFSGDWDGALALGTRAIELARSLHQDALLVRLLVWTSSVYVGRGDLAGAEELIAEAVQFAEESPWPRRICLTRGSAAEKMSGPSMSI